MESRVALMAWAGEADTPLVTGTLERGAVRDKHRLAVHRLCRFVFLQNDFPACACISSLLTRENLLNWHT
jgi:hypothetical protein